jgi:hypothetical protein
MEPRNLESGEGRERDRQRRDRRDGRSRVDRRVDRRPHHARIRKRDRERADYSEHAALAARTEAIAAKRTRGRRTKSPSVRSSNHCGACPPLPPSLSLAKRGGPQPGTLPAGRLPINGQQTPHQPARVSGTSRVFSLTLKLRVSSAAQGRCLCVQMHRQAPPRELWSAGPSVIRWERSRPTHGRTLRRSVTRRSAVTTRQGSAHEVVCVCSESRRCPSAIGRR